MTLCRDGTEVDDRPHLPLGLALGLFYHPPRHLLRQLQRRHQVLLQQRINRTVFHIQWIGGQHLPRGINKDIDLIISVDRGRDEVGDGQPLA